MKKSIIVLPLVFSLLSTTPVFGHGTGLATEDGSSVLGADVSTELESSNPGVLPTNPFYFLKEFGRGIKLFFLFNPVDKLRYESDVVNEKAAELKKVVELNPENNKAIEKALNNYNNNIARLRNHLESLRLTSNNPNIDRLLNELRDRASSHQKLFEELAEKQSDLHDKFEAVNKRLTNEVIGTLEEKLEGSEREEVNEQEEDSIEKPEASKTREVTITDAGFSPKEIKINKGDTVVWTNRGASLSWPASAIHPTHSLYPEKGGCIDSAFDTCRGLGKGESFNFSFNQVGSWKYHDHLNPALVGTIIVE